VICLDTIAKYMKNPMAAGVSNVVLTIDFSQVSDYLGALLTEQEKTLGKRFRGLMEDRLNRLREQLAELDGIGKGDYFTELSELMSSIAYFCNCPKEMKETFTRTSGVGPKAYSRPRRVQIFDSRKLLNDVVYVSKEEATPKKWLFDATSIKEEGIK